MEKDLESKISKILIKNKKIKKTLNKLIKENLIKLMKTNEFKKIVNKVLEEEFEKMSIEFGEVMRETIKTLMNPETYEESGEVLDVCSISPENNNKKEKDDDESGTLSYIS